MKYLCCKQNIILLLILSLSNFVSLASDLTNVKSPNKQQLPNFLVIIVDDLGFMDIAANNPNTFYQTPNINQLAKESTNFSNSYAANPVCSPSRVALMTGINPAKINATDWFHHKNGKRLSGTYQVANSIDYLPHSTTTIAEALPAHYQTSFIGKWHLGEEEKYWPENQGFDSNIAGWSSGSPRGGYFAPYKNPRLAQGVKGEYLTERLTNEAIEQLAYITDDPFLMVLSYYSVHVPLQAPSSTVAKYQQRSADHRNSVNFAEEEQVLPQNKKPRKVRIKQNHPTYAAMVEHMDANVGRVLAELNRSGLDKNTVVIFTSDNGGLSTSEGSPTSNLPYRGGKGWIYEGGIKVPLIVKIPETGLQNKIVKTPVIGMDIPATILALANVKIANLDGKSLLPLMRGTENEIHAAQRPLFWHYPHYSNQGGVPAAAVRLGEFKLIQRLETGKVNLFNLNNDPGELNDISISFPEKKTQLLNLLTNWYKDVDAQFLKPKANKSPWQLIGETANAL
jgi:arylsulfatase A-like enzyme